MKKIICSKILFFVFFLLAIFPLLSFKVIAEEKEATSIEKKKIEIEIDAKWVRMDTAVKEISADKMKVTRSFADRDPMGITIYFDGETKVVRGDNEELKVSDIKQGDKVENLL